jgi:hypothetical protein
MAEATPTVNAQAPDKNRLKSNGKSLNLKYPLDLGENYPHSVDFVIYIPRKSSFNKTVKKAENTTNVSNYAEIGGFKEATGAAQAIYAVQGGYQIAKDSALGAATGSAALGGRGVAGFLGKLVGGATGAAFGAAASVVTNSKTQAAIKGAIATELIKKQTELTGLKVERTAEKIDGMVSLYMPANFFTTYGHDYDQISVKEAGGMLGMLGAGGQSLLPGEGDIKSMDDFKRYLSQLPGTKNPYMALATGAIGSSTQTPLLGGSLVGSGFADVSLFNMGYAQNPMLEVLYRGTNFRSFQFEFMFQPKNGKEAREVQEIIKTFKFHAAPETNPLVDPVKGFGGPTPAPMFFVPPSEFGITLRHGDIKNPFLPRIGRCVLNRIDVDYSPSGQWQTYADGVPIETRLRLDFTEVELVTKTKIESEGY